MCPPSHTGLFAFISFVFLFLVLVFILTSGHSRNSWRFPENYNIDRNLSQTSSEVDIETVGTETVGTEATSNCTNSGSSFSDIWDKLNTCIYREARSVYASLWAREVYRRSLL